MTINFVLNGEPRSETSISPTRTVLEYLREDEGLTGTKEGCAEGDCGACSIVMVRNGSGKVEAVNSCLLTMGQLDGTRLATVEGLSDKGGELEAVQGAIVDEDGTQCGFCTPGFVMALHAFRHSGESVSDEAIHDALAGNLCRCTGYRSIVAAAHAAMSGNVEEAALTTFAEPSATELYEAQGQSFLSPQSLDALIAARVEHPGAPLLSGGTDLGLSFSKDRAAFPVTIFTQNVVELKRIEEDDAAIILGAAVTYSEALARIEELFPSFAVLIHRIGSRQIRNVGTFGGNIGNASPIGDTPPCLIALDTALTLHGPKGARDIQLEDFFLDYRKTDLAGDEVIASLTIPKLGPDQNFRSYKVSKRYDQDISAVVGAFRLTISDGLVTEARIAFGGMAATPKRAPRCEAALVGQPWSEESAARAGAAVADDFQPIDDHRATADYRVRVAANLFVRLHRDLEGADDIEVTSL
ncbi:MAG: xanthine dehydrogenase small subunit [Rhodospirillaceae bacterium]|nr:xanthine dehydrogenase small subunit [Rhodospirillaceae bacterium]MBT6403991.1 xanthine dehydrogenase small subunit [Rhodospirillaceae bacterium]MBT6536621.1 xanthine dehydrogenase small subunit [Rhodospirillaceae bacterium]